MTETSLRIKLQVYCGVEIAMGPGKAALLDAIAREKSISGAARALGMSYRRAWMLVDTMNRCWREPLVTTAPGGIARGGGARVSPFGARVREHYQALLLHVGEAGSSPPWPDLASALLGEPRVRQDD